MEQEGKSAAGFRIAVRTEGNLVNAYFAPPDTMDGAIFIASIHLSIVSDHRVIFDEWQGLLRKAFELHMKAMGVTPAAWITMPGPENEKVGRA